MRGFFSWLPVFIILVVLVGFELWVYFSFQNKSAEEVFCPVPRRLIFCPKAKKVVLRGKEQGVGFALKEGSAFFAPISGTLRQSGSITFVESVGGGTYPVMEIEGDNNQKVVIIYTGPVKGQLRQVKAGEELERVGQGWIKPYGKVNLVLQVFDANGRLIPQQKITLR